MMREWRHSGKNSRERPYLDLQVGGERAIAKYCEPLEPQRATHWRPNIQTYELMGALVIQTTTGAVSLSFGVRSSTVVLVSLGKSITLNPPVRFKQFQQFVFKCWQNPGLKVNGFLEMSVKLLRPQQCLTINFVIRLMVTSAVTCVLLEYFALISRSVPSSSLTLCPKGAPTSLPYDLLTSSQLSRGTGEQVGPLQFQNRRKQRSNWLTGPVYAENLSQLWAVEDSGSRYKATTGQRTWCALWVSLAVTSSSPEALG